MRRYVPGAGPEGVPLLTAILSVDGNGQATLAASASTAVAASPNNVWVGRQVPQKIQLAIQFMTQFFFEQGATTDLPTPRVVEDLLEMYINRAA